jgi:LacI family repressor for deo operon, udp, cdd, tsx, nupC, and nupG
MIGETASKMLMARIINPHDDHTNDTAILPISLVIRESTAKYKT